jgi:CheY-like chemotaxis protein
MGMTQAATPPDEESTDKKPHHYRILVVDDDKSCAKTTMWTLELLGHTVQMALDGKTAIELAKSFHPEVVLLDIGLPGMNGYVICKAMRREHGLEHTVFVAQTGWGQKEHRERSKEAGFDFHLVKPVAMETLKNILLGLDKERR